MYLCEILVILINDMTESDYQIQYIHIVPLMLILHYQLQVPERTNQTGVLVTGYQALSGRLKLLPVGLVRSLKSQFSTQKCEIQVHRVVLVQGAMSKKSLLSSFESDSDYNPAVSSHSSL